MGQTATLFAARRRALLNARKAQRGAFRPWVVIGGLLALLGIFGIGHVAAPSLIDVPAEMATPTFNKRGPAAGDAALETAFWLASLLASFFAFRVMESLFRAPGVRALELLPVRPAPIFVERTSNATIEALGLAALVSAFFAPLAWHGYPQLAALCALICFGAMLSAAFVTIGINAWFGAQYGGSSGLGDGYGGQGGAFIYAPMVSFAMAVVCVMMLQLGAREALHRGALSNAFWLAVAIAVGVSLITLLVGARHFVASYHRVAAFFREADEVGFRAVMDYQQSTWLPTRFESLAGEGRWIFRRHVLQFGRRFPVGRSLVLIGSVGGAIAAYTLSANAFPNWAVAVIPAALFALLERPFGRVFDELLGGASDVLLPVREHVFERATAAWWFYEVARIALPYALVAGVLRGVSESVGAGLFVAVTAIIVSFALPAAMTMARRVGVRNVATTNVVAVLVVVVCSTASLGVSAVL